ncbi:alpha/beta hydrolase [Polyangium sp. 6x1]|uniref:alpha/beta hydrolase n=1 Tax=Polyangium sp. 6x1 TaxID=3042689 RepID=UPI0024825EF3|nr:alpha/beta hydrolase [Polyangium sp. 6x1]MDI1452000.1 alpha/beta hydrolase [Polyangium sp. 6x1]
MSLQAIALRFYLRYWFKRRLDPNAPVSALRANIDDLVRRMPKPPPGVTVLPTNAGGVPAEWVTAAGADERRVLLHFHGGGYASGSPASVRDLAWRLSEAARCRVLVVDYRLAPEHPFPAAIEDAASAYRHLLSNGFAPASIAFSGDSAGGGLVLGSLVKLRDDGAPMPAAACCFSPWTDLAMTGGTITTNRDADPMVRAEALPQTAAWYLGSTPATSPYASPLYADVRGLPPTLLHAGSTEVLLDDARRLAENMKTAKVDVHLRIWPDMPHVFQGCAAFLPEAREAIAEAGQFLDARMLRAEQQAEAA